MTVSRETCDICAGIDLDCANCELSRAVLPADPGQRCPALAYTNDPARLVVRCMFPAGHGGSHLEDRTGRDYIDQEDKG